MHIDSYLERVSIKCGRRHPAQVYFTDKCTKEQYERYTTKLREQEEHTDHLTKKINPQKKSNDEKVNRVLTHNEEVRKGTIELKEKQEKIAIEEATKRRAQKQVEAEAKDLTKLEGEFKKMFDIADEELKEIYKLDEKKVGQKEAWKKYQVKKQKSYKEILKQQQESYQQDSNTGGELNDN